ncbi:hypothetical protein CFOL_v3_00620 [Cephalotus follicularis]|uniref:Uncharacterized protein n=1 Tax=Cephalotus follicularis TaxID=3775 RepID=A0A1Q3AND5_CEPFO|nr:hypothetical protein CFOL_v3_00620 [Cephalotus follicularis]
MHVEDALLQLPVRIKRASKTVYQNFVFIKINRHHTVIYSARANATHNHGLDPGRVVIFKRAITHVMCGASAQSTSLLCNGILSRLRRKRPYEGFFKKCVSYNAKGRSGVRVRPECTVVVREMTHEEEVEIARLRVSNFCKLTKRESRLVPHKLTETTPIWNRKGKAKSESSAMAV